MKSTNRVYNSSLPASIYTDRTKVEKSLRTPKFSVGPTSPKPGPTLPRHVMTDEKHVIKSAFSKAIRMAPKKNRKDIQECMVGYGGYRIAGNSPAVELYGFDNIWMKPLRYASLYQFEYDYSSYNFKTAACGCGASAYEHQDQQYELTDYRPLFVICGYISGSCYYR